MTLNPQYFTTLWLILGGLLYGWVLLKAVRAAPWWRLRDYRDLNVLLYAMLGLFFIWLINTEFKHSLVFVGPTLHLLGATLMTLMFGWAFAIIAMSLVILAFTITTAPSLTEHLYTLPWNVLLTCVLPVFLSYRIFDFVDRRLPNNFFVYIFVCAFFTAGLSMASVVLATAWIHYLSGAYSMEKLGYNYIPFGLILAFPEAFTTGMLMTNFVAYRPHWVSTFDDQRYLGRKHLPSNKNDHES